jgi:hypothetical protein
MNEPTPIRLSLPVTILLERRMISRSFWSMPSWYLHTVAVGRHVMAGSAGRAPVREDSGTEPSCQVQSRCEPAVGSAAATEAVSVGRTDKGELFAWSGFQVRLFKDACERYWHALIGDKPLVYVVCRDLSVDDGDCKSNVSIRPAFVTIDYDEAVAAVETDALVLSGPIPAELYRFMEEFVLQHYTPRTLKKRKRREWTDKGDESGRIRGGQTGHE